MAYVYNSHSFQALHLSDLLHARQRSPASNAPGVCNGHLPTNSIYTRFLWVIRFLVRNHFYVVLDNQLNIDSTALDDPVRWVGLWEQLLSDVVADPVSKARVMVDILNEPDSRDLQCAPIRTPTTPWGMRPGPHRPMGGLRSAPALARRCPHCWARSIGCLASSACLVWCLCNPGWFVGPSAACQAPPTQTPCPVPLCAALY